jgi:2,3-bisphosphoglycerate-independent phosphoglycerate mutase
MMHPHVLIILDGYGIADDPTVSAVDRAHKPNLDRLFEQYPHGRLSASGLDVGLPNGQMGNSEVGHMNLGAGRVVYQDITRIDKAISDGAFSENTVLREAMRSGGRVHLMGLVSDGGVHASINHVLALLEMAHGEGLRGEDVVLHAFTDGRDTDPRSGRGHVARVSEEMERLGTGVVGTIAGRYWAMDRDNRWERVQKAYDAIVNGRGAEADSSDAVFEHAYREGTTDEFIEPTVLANARALRIRPGDAVIFFNFRADRARELTQALIDPSFAGFPVEPLLPLHYVTFTPYDARFDVAVAFPKVNLTQTLGEVVAGAGGRQLRAAETEKYPHVTYFFSGGREAPFDGEDRVLVASPKVATYDLQPEMSAPELTDRILAQLKEQSYTLVVVNYANPDMVGHTGDLEATVRAIETVDECVGRLVALAREQGYDCSIIADHGNADRMQNPDGSPHTAHTTVEVPHLIVSDRVLPTVRTGRLADVAVTILDLIGLEPSSKMTGESLVTRK